MANFNTVGMGSHGSFWQAHGYSGNGNVVDLIDSQFNRPAVVAGGAACVFQDLPAALELVPDPLIFAVNDIGMYLPRIHYWVSLHENNLEKWLTIRHMRYVGDVKFHTYQPQPKNVIGWYDWMGLNPIFALSGYFAMQIAWIMGCSPIILAGCPGSIARRFFEAFPTEASHGEVGVQEQIIREMNRLPDFKRVVRSMSGWTRSFFNHNEGRDKWQLLRR